MSGAEFETKIFSDEQMLNSDTFKKLSVLSRVNPINASDPVEVEESLASPLFWLIDALDNDSIQFQNKADKNALFQMLLVCHQLVTQPKPASATRH